MLSDVAIGSVLMQEKQERWYRPVFYASRRLSSDGKELFGDRARGTWHDLLCQ